MRVGWAGLHQPTKGQLGATMCKHLVRAGHNVSVYATRPHWADELVSLGATPRMECAREAAQGAEVVFHHFGYPHATRQHLFGPKGALSGMAPGTVLCQLSPTNPSLAQEIAAAGKEVGVEVIDAPATGGIGAAALGRLTFYCGGPGPAFDTIRPLLSLMGSAVAHAGEIAGSGQQSRMIRQAMGCGGMLTVVQALLHVRREGAELSSGLPEVIRVLSLSATEDFTSFGYGLRFGAQPDCERFRQDLEVIIQEARNMEMDLPGLGQAKLLLDKLTAEGEKGTNLRGPDGVNALAIALDHVNHARGA